MHNAPVILFAYNRPLHLSRTLEHLRLNYGAGETTLYVFAEGPKSGADSSELEKIKEVRRIIHDIKGFKNIVIQESESNAGCANSMISGISKVMAEHGKGIILEDDIITHPSFLSWCNEGLEFYEQENSIKQIGGFMFPVKGKLPSIVLSRVTFCWGWATWKRAWDELSMDAEMLMGKIISKNLTHAFDLNGNYPYFKSLKQQAAREIDAWDICWYASVFLDSGLGVYPGKSLTQNIGMDGSGTHFTNPVSIPDISFRQERNIKWEFPIVNEPDKQNEYLIQKAVYSWARGPFSRRLKSKIGGLVKRILPVSKE